MIPSALPDAAQHRALIHLRRCPLPNWVRGWLQSSKLLIKVVNYIWNDVIDLARSVILFKNTLRGLSHFFFN